MSDKKITARTETGGKATIVDYSGGTTANSIGGGASNLTQAQMDAYQEAKLIADKRNGGDFDKAKAMLEKAGFTAYWG